MLLEEGVCSGCDGPRRSVAERSYPSPKIRGSGREELPHIRHQGGGREEQPHVQGAVAARAQEG